MRIKHLFLTVLLPVALMIQSCGPEDVVNPVTPPSGTQQEDDDDDSGTTTPSGESVSMIVCTFNIRYANTADVFPDGSSAAWSVRRDAVKKFVDTVKPDIIGMQEVRKAQAQDFASFFSTDYGYYDVGRDSASGSSITSANCEGVGILYRKDRFEPTLKDFFWLDTQPRILPVKNEDGTYGDWMSACRRITVYMVLKDKKNNDALIYFFPSHYDHKSTVARKNASQLNIDQIKNIAKVTDIKDGNKIIFHVGDLNTTYDSGQLNVLNDNMHYARMEAGGNDKYTGTFNGFGKSDSQIDHIYYGGKAVKALKYWVDKTNYGVPYISDHYPVLFQWEYQ